MNKFELNKRLAELLGLNVVPKRRVPTEFENDNICCLSTDGNRTPTILNYCEFWDDIMPIAFELEVSYFKVSRGYVVFDNSWDYIDISRWDERGSLCMNPEFEVVDEDDLKIALVKCCIAVLESKVNEGVL